MMTTARSNKRTSRLI